MVVNDSVTTILPHAVNSPIALCSLPIAGKGSSAAFFAGLISDLSCLQLALRPFAATRHGEIAAMRSALAATRHGEIAAMRSILRGAVVNRFALCPAYAAKAACSSVQNPPVSGTFRFLVKLT